MSIEATSRNFVATALTLAALVGLAPAQEARATEVSDPAQPRVFAPGVISVPGENIYRGTFTTDGSAFFFFRRVDPDQFDYRIFLSRRAGEGWAQPERVDLGGEHSDLYPAFSRDGRHMVFTSYRKVDGDTTAEPNANLWLTERTDMGWAEPVLLAAATTLANYESNPWFDAAGDLHFVSLSPDWRTRYLRVARRDAAHPGGYGPHEPDVEGGRWQDWGAPRRYVWSATFNADQSLAILYVSTVDEESGRRSPSDLWFSRRTGDSWSEPRPLGAGVNTAASEGYALFTSDGQELFFHRNNELYYRVDLAAALGGSDAPVTGGSER